VTNGTQIIYSHLHFISGVVYTSTVRSTTKVPVPWTFFPRPPSCAFSAEDLRIAPESNVLARPSRPMVVSFGPDPSLISWELEPLPQLRRRHSFSRTGVSRNSSTRLDCAIRWRQVGAAFQSAIFEDHVGRFPPNSMSRYVKLPAASCKIKFTPTSVEPGMPLFDLIVRCQCSASSFAKSGNKV